MLFATFNFAWFKLRQVSANLVETVQTDLPIGVTSSLLVLVAVKVYRVDPERLFGVTSSLHSVLYFGARGGDPQGIGTNEDVSGLYARSTLSPFENNCLVIGRIGT